MKDSIYKEGFDSMEENQCSPETLKQLAQMSEDITQLKVSNTRIETKVDNIIDTLKAHIEDETKYRELQDKQHKDIMDAKADKYLVDGLIDNQKWVVRSIIGIILSAVIGVILVK